MPKQQLISYSLGQMTSEKHLLSSNSAQLLRYWATLKITDFWPYFLKLINSAVVKVGLKFFSPKYLSVYGGQKNVFMILSKNQLFFDSNRFCVFCILGFLVGWWDVDFQFQCFILIYYSLAIIWAQNRQWWVKNMASRAKIRIKIRSKCKFLPAPPGG